MIDIKQVDHIGIRVMDAQRALAFYGLLGFEKVFEAQDDAVIIIANQYGVEINLIVNASDANEGRNILMDVPTKYAGYTHVALRVGSIKSTLAELERLGIRISQGPVVLGGEDVSIFLRDPDRNVIELRGRGEKLDEIEGLERYEPEHRDPA